MNVECVYAGIGKTLEKGAIVIGFEILNAHRVAAEYMIDLAVRIRRGNIPAPKSAGAVSGLVDLF